MTTLEQKLKQLIGELQFQHLVVLQKSEEQEQELNKLKKEIEELKNAEH